MRIIYVGSYINEQFSSDNRFASPASITKCNYILKKLAGFCDDLTIVSIAQTQNKKGFIPKRTGKTSTGAKFVMCPTFGAKSKFLSFARKVFSRFWLFFFLFWHSNKKTKVVVYHSLSVILPVKVSRFFKKYELILEVEEIYSSFQTVSNYNRKKELSFLKSPQKYLFVSELLQEKINVFNKPSLVSYGSYETSSRQFVADDPKKHIVYAGTFDINKGGVYSAIESALYLDSNYIVHILGFGSSEEIELVKHKIDYVNKNSSCQIVFEGCLLGDAYFKILDKCSIGLSVQNVDADFNLTSFPSKILVYMSHNLQVIASRIDVLERSKLNSYLNYVNGNDPKEIAKAILSISKKPIVDEISVLQKLDCSFSIDFKSLVLGE